jgi:hypothetical protein
MCFRALWLSVTAPQQGSKPDRNAEFGPRSMCRTRADAPLAGGRPIRSFRLLWPNRQRLHRTAGKLNGVVCTHGRGPHSDLSATHDR